MLQYITIFFSFLLCSSTSRPFSSERITYLLKTSFRWSSPEGRGFGGQIKLDFLRVWLHFGYILRVRGRDSTQEQQWIAACRTRREFPSRMARFLIAFIIEVDDVQDELLLCNIQFQNQVALQDSNTLKDDYSQNCGILWNFISSASSNFHIAARIFVSFSAALCDWMLITSLDIARREPEEPHVSVFGRS